MRVQAVRDRLEGKHNTLHPARDGGPIATESAWDPDIRALNARLVVVHEWVEKRKVDEKEKPGKSRPKSKQTKSAGPKKRSLISPKPMITWSEKRSAFEI